MNFLLITLIVAIFIGTGFVSSLEKIACGQVDCSDGDFLIFAIRDCKLKAGLRSLSGDLRESTTITPRLWAQGIATHLENGCNHRELQVAETQCVELPYKVCQCPESNIATVRKTTQIYKNCEKSLADTILLAINRMPLRVDWDGAAIFKPPEPRVAPDAVSYCITETTLENRQTYCENQEIGIVSKLLSGQVEMLEKFYAAKQKAAISLISCLRTGLERFSHCPDDVVSAYLATYYELAIAPGVLIPSNFLNASFIPMPLQMRAVIGAVTTRHLFVSDRILPLLCALTEVNVLLLTNDYVDLTALTQRFSDTPKFTQFIASFYRPESPHAPIITVVIRPNDVRLHFTVDPHVVEDAIEIHDTWQNEKMLTINDLHSSTLFIFQRNDPDYLNVLILISTSVLEHSAGYLVSGCNQQSLELEDEINNFREENVSPQQIANCDIACKSAIKWSDICFYDCMVYNETSAVENVIAVYLSYLGLFPSENLANTTLDDPSPSSSSSPSFSDHYIVLSQSATPSGPLLISSAFALKFDSVLTIPLLSTILRF